MAERKTYPEGQILPKYRTTSRSRLKKRTDPRRGPEMTEISERKLRALEALLVEYLKGQEGTPAAYLHQSLGYVRASLGGAQRKIVDTDYPDKGDKNLVREIILVEVLSEGGTGDADLADIAEGIGSGPWSGEVEHVVTETVAPNLMAGLLTEQRSDPGFLLGEPEEEDEEEEEVAGEGEVPSPTPAHEGSRLPAPRPCPGCGADLLQGQNHDRGCTYRE